MFENFADIWEDHSDRNWQKALDELASHAEERSSYPDFSEHNYEDSENFGMEGVDLDDLNLQGLTEAIDRKARNAKVYQQSALQLAEQCRILVNAYNLWEEEYSGCSSAASPPSAQERVVYHVSSWVSEKNLESDLKRVLRFLQAFDVTPERFTESPSRVSTIVLNSLGFLCFPRPFICRTDEVLNTARTSMQKAIRYDQVELEYLSSLSCRDATICNANAIYLMPQTSLDLDNPLTESPSGLPHPVNAQSTDVGEHPESTPKILGRLHHKERPVSPVGSPRLERPYESLDDQPPCSQPAQVVAAHEDRGVNSECHYDSATFNPTAPTSLLSGTSTLPVDRLVDRLVPLPLPRSQEIGRNARNIRLEELSGGVARPTTNVLVIPFAILAIFNLALAQVSIITGYSEFAYTYFITGAVTLGLWVSAGGGDACQSRASVAKPSKIILIGALFATSISISTITPIAIARGHSESVYTHFIAVVMTLGLLVSAEVWGWVLMKVWAPVGNSNTHRSWASVAKLFATYIISLTIASTAIVRRNFEPVYVRFIAGVVTLGLLVSVEVWVFMEVWASVKVWLPMEVWASVGNSNARWSWASAAKLNKIILIGTLFATSILILTITLIAIPRGYFESVFSNGIVTVGFVAVGYRALVGRGRGNVRRSPAM